MRPLPVQCLMSHLPANRFSTAPTPAVARQVEDGGLPRRPHFMASIAKRMRATQEAAMFDISRATKCGAAFLVTAMLASVPSRTYAEDGSIRMRISKVGFIVGVGGGSGVLTFKGRHYRLSIGGVSAGTIGVAAMD